MHSIMLAVALILPGHHGVAQISPEYNPVPDPAGVEAYQRHLRMIEHQRRRNAPVYKQAPAQSRVPSKKIKSTPKKNTNLQSQANPEKPLLPAEGNTLAD